MAKQTTEYLFGMSGNYFTVELLYVIILKENEAASFSGDS